MKSDDVKLMEEAAATEEKEPKEPATLEAVHARATRLVELHNAIADTEATLVALKKEREKIRIRELPEMMTELKMTSLGIGNDEVKLEIDIYATVPKDTEKRKALFDYLVDIKEGGGIKRNIAVSLSKGDAVMEQRVLQALRDVSPSLNPQIETSIHPSTYSALCRRLVQSGKDVSLQLLNCFVNQVARVNGE